MGHINGASHGKGSKHAHGNRGNLYLYDIQRKCICILGIDEIRIDSLA